MNILFICGRNKRRSRTAETIFRNDQRFTAKSAGLSEKSPVKVSAKLLLWADLILVMEYCHHKRIKREYSSLQLPPIECLQIDDVYEYMDEDLVEMLEVGVEGFV